MKVFKKLSLLFFTGQAFLTMGSSMATSIEPNIRSLIDELLNKELKVTATDISVLSAKKVEWPSSALGCSQSGQFYMPVITPGYRVKVSVNQSTYTIHTSLKHAVLCKNKAVKTEASPQMKSNNKKIRSIQLARENLIKLKNIDKNSIRLVSVDSQLLSEQNTQCKKKFTGSEKGFLVVLKHHLSQIGFFSDGITAVQCWRKE